MAFSNMSRARKVLVFGAGVLGAAGAGTAYALNNSVNAWGLVAKPAAMPWSHNHVFASLDHASIRRGYEVYKNVCAACHSMQYICFRHLTDVTHTADEVKALAAEFEVEDGPDENGERFMRPCLPTDTFPAPYQNDVAARVANNGALPPDLSLIALARAGGEDYIFSLLTGYCDPPAGAVGEEGMHFNPYFPGYWIGMARALYNELLEYEDGTPATASQMAKDVSTFLVWSASQEFDARKRMSIKILVVGLLMCGSALYYKRFLWTTIKSRKVLYQPINKRPTSVKA